ncbi:g6289 [Coccomyxa viridis]|uniref:beta-aspartyl-peptidase n=1 Tax=Coccomyxa viridis TaxID=1274662 RepID=A0ABP1FV04_9CHLO
MAGVLLWLAPAIRESLPGDRHEVPIVVATWAFTAATDAAWAVLASAGTDASALAAVEEGCSTCENMQCDLTVGFGGSPDEQGQTTLDALIMDGTRMDVGAVTDLQYINNAISTARKVMEHSLHTSLGGLQATNFAVEMGGQLANLSTEVSSKMYYDWKAANCQPNFRKAVHPDPTKSCGPYKPLSRAELSSAPLRKRDEGAALPRGLQEEDHLKRTGREAGPDLVTRVSRKSHDTISMVALDREGNIAAGSSTNGASHKIPGRMSDSAVAGAGAYAETGVGGCGSTGDGDIHLRFLPCYQAVESMRQGMSPKHAAEDAVQRIARHYPTYIGAVVAVDDRGRHGAAAHGWTFEYTVRSHTQNTTVYKVDPIGQPSRHQRVLKHLFGSI